jgi:hypothetical protein
MGCEYFPDEELAHWVWYDPEANDTQRFDVPQCWPRCPGKPPVIANTMKNWTKSVYIFFYLHSSWDISQNTAFSTNLPSFQLLSILCHCMQPCPAALPGSLARQPCPTALPDSLAQQPCPTSLPGNLALKPCINITSLITGRQNYKLPRI